MASPDHPNYTADKAVARKIAGGKSALIAAIDGVGSGGEQSAQAAEVVQRSLSKLETSFVDSPTINQAVTELKNAIFAASLEIRQLQQSSKNKDVDTTVSAGIVCESPDKTKKFLVTANVGDSRVYKYTPMTGNVEQVTIDQSLVQSLVDQGLLSSDEAFLHPQRNVIYKGVGSLAAPKEIGIRVTTINNGDVITAVSDGASDNLTPTGLPIAIKDEFKSANHGGELKLDQFTGALAQRAQNIMKQETASWAKKDDVCVTAIRIPLNA